MVEQSAYVPEKSIRDTIDRSFANLCLNPGVTSSLGCELPTLEEVTRRLGPDAALALADVRAAQKSFRKAVNRFLAARESR